MTLHTGTFLQDTLTPDGEVAVDRLTAALHVTKAELASAFGLSRDDAGKFLGDYLEAQIFEKDPFVSLDQEGVGDLIKIAVERGRETSPDIKLGICGEHGGDPASIRFCEMTGLDYVSCSPYRVPIARLAAAQAALGKRA